MQHRGCEASLKHRGWVCAFGLVLFGRAFSGSFFWVRSFGRSFRGSCFWVRAFGRSFRGSFFGFVLFGRSVRGSFFCSCFWSFFGFVLFGRSFWGSFFWFVLLGARMCFLFDALKVLEACVARSEVS